MNLAQFPRTVPGNCAKLGAYEARSNCLELDVVVERELPGMRSQPDLVELVHRLVLDPRLDEIVGEDSTDREELVVALERAERGVERRRHLRDQGELLR